MPNYREGSELSCRRRPMTTAGQLANKILELRSKIAVTEGVILYLTANYLPTREGSVPSDLTFTNADGSTVSETHVGLVVADYVEHLDQLRADLEKWENTPVQELVAASKSNGIHTEKKPKKKETKDGVRAKGRDQDSSPS